MCGIVGIASKNQIIERDWLSMGIEEIHHRGPDDKGEWWSPDGFVGMGHRRLSIIDLSDAGHQPMSDDSGLFHIVFNGEIYNFKELRTELIAKGYFFRSKTDTEVIIAAYREWGENCFSKLNGMFALAIFDSTQKKLFLARDRAGEKPLFYYFAEGTIRYGSELKALLADKRLPRKISMNSLEYYLARGYVPGSRCILEGFNKLPPAHTLRFDIMTGEIKVSRYWQLPPLTVEAVDGQVDEAALLNELEVLLEDSVGRQLQADVPVGVLLSGGVDSSLVTAMAVRISKNVKTFTIRFPGFGKLDETEHARLIAKHFNTEHIELEAQPTTVELLPRLAAQFDEPIVDSSMIPTFLVCQLVKQHCTVALGGDGGDELFGGYEHYNRLLWMHSKLGSVPKSLRSMVSNVAGEFLPIGFKGRNWIQASGADLNKELPMVATHFDVIARKKLLLKYNIWEVVKDRKINEFEIHQSDLLQRATRTDFYNYLAEDILVKVDRASMLNSLEIRAPLLDFRLCEFAFGKVPTYLKTSPNERKILLKRLAARILPPEFDKQRKQGFSIPLPAWLKSGPFRDFFYDLLLDKDCIFERRAVESLIKGQDRRGTNAERLFSLVVFELWKRNYSATI